MSCLLGTLSFGLLLLLSLLLPLHNQESYDQLLSRYQETMTSHPDWLPVFSFNIRLDMLEDDPNNHFTKRVFRLGDFVEKMKPALVGLQEPFSGQLVHLQRHLPANYGTVGWEREGDKTHPSRHHDYQTAILYDKDRLRLIASDHFWLSLSPREPHSKSWDSRGIRTVTIASFRYKEVRDVEDGYTGPHLIHFNTHLDVWGKEARSEQAKVILSVMKKYRQKYPRASMIVTGDFNAANGHHPHRILLEDGLLEDAWDACARDNEGCLSHQFSTTFHGWWGTSLDKYAVRLLHYLCHTVHGSGVQGLPASLRLPTWEEFKLILTSLKPKQLLTGLPDSIFRLHVDWVLISKGFQVRMAFVGELRDQDFSSDHFPVITLLERVNK